MNWIFVLCILAPGGGCRSIDNIPVTREQCDQLLAEYRTDRRVIVYCRPKKAADDKRGRS